MSNNPLPNRERIKLPRQKMPEQLAQRRAHNFQEVNSGFAPEQARQESLRCIECNKPGCMNQCPVSVDVRAVMDLIVAGDYMGAAAKVREDNALPAITGRVCPVEDQCEAGCVLGKKGEPVGIAYLERFVADWERQSGQLGLPTNIARTGRKVAIIGSGPAGLACAGDLVQMGHHVHVFEALHELGGVLVYGIPEFRLPKEIVAHEVQALRLRGVEFETNVVVGKTVTIDELFNKEGYDAAFVATGAGLPRFLNVRGEHLNGIYSAMWSSSVAATPLWTRFVALFAWGPEQPASCIAAPKPKCRRVSRKCITPKTKASSSRCWSTRWNFWAMRRAISPQRAAPGWSWASLTNQDAAVQ
jgi:glutamate synthase (NADPH/NADH) small chain